MAIIELALITLRNNLTPTDTLLKKNLREVKRVIENFSHLPTIFYNRLDDPSTMFVISAWETMDHHHLGFNGSPAQLQILDLIKDQMSISWMHYIDVEQSKIPLDAPVLAIIKEAFAKYGVNKTDFDLQFDSQTGSGIGGARHGAVSGWNIRQDKHERDIRVHFSGWDSLEEAMGSITSTIETVEGFRATPTELNFFFVEQTKLD